MSNNIHDIIYRLNQLKEAHVDIQGPNDLDYEDESEGEWDQQSAREQKIVGFIRNIFQKIGLEINSLERHPISYDESVNREATVQLEDDEISLAALMKLHGTGLATDYAVLSWGGTLAVRFIVPAELDNATLG